MVDTIVQTAFEGLTIVPLQVHAFQGGGMRAALGLQIFLKFSEPRPPWGELGRSQSVKQKESRGL